VTSSDERTTPAHLDTGRLVKLLREIYATASVPWKMTGKFAYIVSLADDALEMLGDRDRAAAESTMLSTEAAELAAGTGMPGWVASRVAALRPVSQGDYEERDGTVWHAEASQAGLIVIRTSRYEIAYPDETGTQ
jgi:hypothetical protein